MESQCANSLHASATDWSIPGIMGKSSTISERGRGSERTISPVLTKSEQLSRTGTETTEREYDRNRDDGDGVQVFLLTAEFVCSQKIGGVGGKKKVPSAAGSRCEKC